MTSEHDEYDNPLITRYASKEMSGLFSPKNRITTWRKLWVVLAECEKKLGLSITDDQIDEMKSNIDNIDWEFAAQKEKELRHDVMAHIHAFGKIAPKAKPIIHLGATSCDITDNADLIIMKQAMKVVLIKLAKVIHSLNDFANKYKSTPILGLTHLQPAQPVTVGKRASLWLHDLVIDYKDIKSYVNSMPMRGLTGATGTQASFLELFNNDTYKVTELNSLFCQKAGWNTFLPITGQTYTRKIDSKILSLLAGIAESACKFATDIRILSSRKEIDEPSESSQVGSSAMAYKKNPMRCERICSLSRYVMTTPLYGYMAQGTQWMERTLDDSAGRRLYIPQAFLAIDAILRLCDNVASGLIVNEEMIKSNLDNELPFMITENILMNAVRLGGDRQTLHEKIRQYSKEAAINVRSGRPNDLIDRLASDPELMQLINPDDIEAKSYIGLSVSQVDHFLGLYVEPIIDDDQFPSDEEIVV